MFNGVPLCHGEVKCHGLSLSSASILEPSFEVLPSELPGHGSFWPENSLVDDCELWPVKVGTVGVEGVAGGSGSAEVIVSEWVEGVPSEESVSVVEEASGVRVRV